jgi:hypothetical protein
VASPHSSDVAELVPVGMDPRAVAERVFAAIQDDELYVFTHSNYRQAVEERFGGILAAFDRLENCEVGAADGSRPS